MKKLAKIIQITVYIVIIVVGLFLVITLFPVKGNYQIKVVLSGSMEPTIHTGSIVVIKPAEQYNVGNIVIFGKDTAKDVPTTHRIVSSRAVEGIILFTTKGDANKSPDTTEIRLSDIHGRVLFSVPYLGYVINFVKKPFGLVLVIVLPAIFIVYDEVRKIVKEVRRMKKPKSMFVQDEEANNPEEHV